MKKNGLLVFVFVLLSCSVWAQTDTTNNDLLNDLLNDGSNTEQELLPKRFPLTQRILWGEKGLMRNFSHFELTPEKRSRELEYRRFALGVHQILGWTTLGGMVAQGIVGSQLYNENYNVFPLHKAIATGVNIGYFTTAGLALLAPPKMLDERKGYSSIKIHKALAYIHMTSMIATNLLAGYADDPKIKPYHRAAAFTAFGSFAMAMIIIKF